MPGNKKIELKTKLIYSFIFGFIIVNINMIPEFFKSIFFALGGGVGERSYWGEPLFYILVFGIPVGLFCMLLALFVIYFFNL
jgi:hypothetical protein